MIYWTIFLLLFTYSIIEYVNRRRNIKAFTLLYILLTILLCLRQGQGTDYYNYFQIYKEVKYFADRSWYLIFAMRDPLYSLINFAFIKLGLSYPWMVGFFSLLTMGIQWNFFRNICGGSCICLFVFYSIVVLPYDFNAMRQGLALAIVIGVLFPLMLQKNYKAFFFWIIVASAIHISAAICLIMPIVFKMKLKKSTMAILILIAGIIIILSSYIPTYFPLPGFMKDRLLAYTTSSSTQILAIINRILLLLPIFVIPERIFIKNSRLNLLRNIIFLGFIVYAIFSFNDFIASRENIYFRVFEGYFVMMIMLESSIKINRSVLMGLYLSVCSLLFIKEVSASIVQGSYNNCNVFTYPYFSIFESNETIREYRTDFGFVDEQL